MGKKHLLVSFKPPRLGTEPRTLALEAAVLTGTLGPPPHETRTAVQSQKVVSAYLESEQILPFVSAEPLHMHNQRFRKKTQP